uniref:Uncharacterized protein n=1 Tax=viral metagenome TaxID=1070528 RepID=A0A6M3Y1B3_9ZZZZ
MKLVYGISRWTNSSRASARHIDNSFGGPLCADKRKVLSWEREAGEPTCKRCISKYKCWFCGEPATGFVLGACTCDRCGRQVARGFNEG